MRAIKIFSKKAKLVRLRNYTCTLYCREVLIYQAIHKLANDEQLAECNKENEAISPSPRVTFNEKDNNGLVLCDRYLPIEVLMEIFCHTDPKTLLASIGMQTLEDAVETRLVQKDRTDAGKTIPTG